MTVPRINALITYWQEQCPPATKSLAAFIGFKGKKKGEPTAQSMEENEKALEKVMEMFPMRAPPPLPFAKPGE